VPCTHIALKSSRFVVQGFGKALYRATARLMKVRPPQSVSSRAHARAAPRSQQVPPRAPSRNSAFRHPSACETGLYHPSACETGLYHPSACETGLYHPSACETGLYHPSACETGVCRALKSSQVFFVNFLLLTECPPSKSRRAPETRPPDPAPGTRKR